MDSGVLVEPVTNMWCNEGLLRVDVQQNSTYPADGYPDRLGPTAKHFLALTALHPYGLNFAPNRQIHITNYVFMLFMLVLAIPECFNINNNIKY